jgi:hypothetical protein|tara:strand:+ start:455 stop:670 length:216 start_codon:yes stop_codon:yes gene_type:complete
MQQNIQQLFNLLDSQEQKLFIIVLSEYYRKKPLSIRNNWFSNYKEIPEKYHIEILTMLQKKIELFNLTPQS